MSRLIQSIPSERRFQLSRTLLDSRVGDVYMRMRGAYGPYRAQADATLVVDGFPRSANTYALFAAEHVLGRGHVRGHTHAAANVKRAVAFGVPTILLVREPRAAVASLVQLADGVSIETAFSAYARFYQRLLPLRDTVYVAEFSDVVNDFGEVMERVNDHFGTTLSVYDKTDENEAEVRRRIDEASAARQGGRVRESGVARPSDRRRSADDVLKDMSKVAEQRCRQAEDAYMAISVST